MVKCLSDQDSGKKLMKGIGYSHTTVMNPVKSFVLKSDTEFESRSSAVFRNLNSLENAHSTWMTENDTYESFESSNATVTKSFDSFKKPFAPSSRNRKSPIISQRKKNAKVWIKYSLKDIPISSDATNAAVAFQFLNELRKQKEKSLDDEKIAGESKVIFRKPLKRGAEIGSSTPSIPGNCDDVNQSNSTAMACIKGKSIKLDHLQDDFDEN